jgi:hypothetical protein
MQLKSNSFFKAYTIKFNLEFRPQSATVDKEYFIDFIADNNAFECIQMHCGDLQKEFENYSERKPAQTAVDPSVQIKFL